MKIHRRMLALIGVLGLAGVLAAGCEENTTVTSSPAEQRGVAVTGTGKVEAASDTGYVTLGVQVSAATVEAARSRGADVADAAIKSVKANGVDAKDVKTTGLSISPQYDYRSSGTPTITGYMVSNTVEVKVRKLDSFSKVVDDAVKAGGNDVRVNGIRFGVEDTEKLLTQAREAAMKDAKTKAEQLAKLGGVGLGDPISITEVTSSPVPVTYGAVEKAADSGSAATPIEPGTGTVSVQLSVRWGLK